MRPAIFIVEDEEVVSLFLRESLNDEGFDVQLFSDATSALKSMDKLGAVAAIIDVGLPDMRGDELARECRSRLPMLPIIIATGYDERRYALDAAIDPLVTILGKPFDIPRLLLQLEKLGVFAPSK